MPQLIDVMKANEGMDKANAFYRYLKQKAWVKGIPLIGLFELTPRCTLDCKMCYVHLTEKQMKHAELSTAQWISLIDQACDAGMMFATLTGGECLLYSGFKEIYEHLSMKGVLITVLTNGTLLDEDIVEWISERTPQRIQISVYGSSPEGYENVTGSAGAFDHVDNAIERLRKHKLPFDLAITVSKQMEDDFEAILRYCLDKNPRKCLVNSCPFDPREETGRHFDDYAPDLDAQVNIIQTQIKMEQQHPKPFSHKGDGRKNPAMPAKGIVCSAGRNSFSVNWEGKMLPCSVFDFAGTYPLAESFEIAWSRMNHSCINYTNPIECIGCSYYYVCRYCPAGHYMKMGEGHADPAVCAESHRMVQERIRNL